MTGRERLSAIMHREPADRLAWTINADGATCFTGLPAELEGASPLELARALGSDIWDFGWATPYGFAAPRMEWPEGVEQTSSTDGDATTYTLRTPAGTLTSTYRGVHPRTYFVETLEDLRIYRWLWEGVSVHPPDATDAHLKGIEALGDDGILVQTLGPSAIPRLLQLDCGTEAFYYLLADHRDEMDGLIRAMHSAQLEVFRIAAASPSEHVVIIENTSTNYISPDIYRRYNGPHMRDFADTMHGAGKTAILHMCGHVRGLLRQIRETGADGVHALTPPPTGDTPWELALDVWGDETIIIGVLDPTVLLLGPLSEIGQTLDRLYTPRLREAHFVLWAAADGLVVPWARLQAVAEWMERNAG